jgi:hypothetical protein
MSEGKRPVNPITGQPATDEEWQKITDLANRLVAADPEESPVVDDDSDSDDTPTG